MTEKTIVIKDPAAVLDYKFDWKAATNGTEGAEGDWLASGETISSKTVAVTTGLTIDSSSITDTSTTVTVWLSGGTADTDYTLSCTIVTSAGRTDKRSITVQVRSR